jgi:hypothetical protein
MKRKGLRFVAAIALIFATAMTPGGERHDGALVVEASEEECHGCLYDSQCAPYWPYTKCKTGSCVAWTKKCVLP